MNIDQLTQKNGDRGLGATPITLTEAAATHKMAPTENAADAFSMG
ncbi:hypothetical protein [Jiella flava]|nr:hypothetical protein [Jiella flava]